jgi:hypothetical protein
MFNAQCSTLNKRTTIGHHLQFRSVQVVAKKIKKKQMKKTIHFFEIAVFAIRLSVMNSDARRAFFSSIRPVL